MKVLICGSRSWSDEETMRTFFLIMSKDTVILHGGCRGADLMADDIAKKFGFEYYEYSANWERYGLAAGPIRNQLMLDEGKPNIVVAFHNNISESKGTKDMIRRARMAGVLCILICSPLRLME